jgi:hypothetical protein
MLIFFLKSVVIKVPESFRETLFSLYVVGKRAELLRDFWGKSNLKESFIVTYVRNKLKTKNKKPIKY